MEASRQQEPAVKGKIFYAKGKALSSLGGWQKEKKQPRADQCYGAPHLMAQEHPNSVHPSFTSRNYSETTSTCKPLIDMSPTPATTE